MADNTTLNPGTGGDTIAADDLTTLNGGAVSGVKVQRVKVGYGSDGSFRDVDASNPLPASVAPPAGIGPQSSAASVSVVISKDQDPIFDHANGTKTSVTASATIITPPTGCLYVSVSSDVDIYVNTAGSTAVDDGTSKPIIANQPEVIPVVAGTAVKALSSAGTATVRCTPMKIR